MRIRLRAAQWEDRQLLFLWANDPVVRGNSFLSATIAWESHLEWFAARLADPVGTRILIGELVEGAPVGQIRFSRSGADAELGYSVAVEHRGKGYGTRLLERGCRRIITLWPDVSEVAGEVKRENVASMRAFERAGFEECGCSTGSARYVWRPQNRRFVVATSRSWFDGMGERLRLRVPASFDLIRAPEELKPASLQSARPGYLFFTDGPWIISEDIYSDLDCVVFKVSDLDLRRGGTSLRNLIERGMAETMITACLVGSGPNNTSETLLGRPLSLHGTDEDIHARATGVIEEMIQEIIEKDLGGGAPLG